MVASVQPFVTITRHADHVFKLVDEADRVHHGAIARALREIGAESARYMRRSLVLGRRTGRLYRIRGRLHRASAPGEFPAKLTGQLSRGVNYDARSDHELEVGVSNVRSEKGAPYARFLEYGTPKMLRRPFIEPTSNRFANSLAIQLLRFSRVALSKGRGSRV